MPKLQRTTFKTSRAAQYVEARALTAMTGQSESKFADVVVKELIDNALDACETSGTAPEITLAVEERFSGGVAITVSDNAGGISQDTVHGALNFDVLVSDKAAYRSPTRGAQGNALKTVFGIPHALGSLEPVVVEAKGTRHEARIWKDLAGSLRMQCDDIDLDEPRLGTSVTAHVPLRGVGAGVFGTTFDPEFWARAFSLFNPHAQVKIQRSEEGVYLGKSSVPVSEDSYLPTRDPVKRFKYVPSDPTSAHWYDVEAFKRLVYSHIGHHRHEGGDDLRLRDFVRQFKGLSATKKAKAVCEHFPKIKTLSDFKDSPEAIHSLLDMMKIYSDAPSHNTLGYVGKDHFRERFEHYYGELCRFDYKKLTGSLHTGMPYVVEFAIAELPEEAQEGELFTAVNYSPTFGDPLEDVRFRVDEISADGIEEFLEDGFVSPEYGNVYDPYPPNTVVAFHVITPAPLFLDQGKTRLEGFTEELEGPAIGKALFSKIKPYYKEGRRRVKSRRSQERSEKSASTDKEMSLKDATNAVLEEAWRHTTGNGQLPVGARRLFYAVRRRIPALTTNRFNPDSGYQYFSQTLLPEYQKQRVKDGAEPLAGVYYDPRGKIHEAHTGKAMDLGTRDVDAYEFPPYTFNKLLYVEKRGQVPLLQAARLAERYDMALVTEAGFATVAARTLLSAGAEGEKYQVFCLHDADYPGYNILRTLREATERMPEHSMEVHDIGLTVEQVIQKGKEPEEYERSSQVPSKLVPLLSPVEREWFIGEYLGKKANKDTYSSKRFELDDLTAPETIAHIEDRLKELGVEPKVIPPEEVLGVRRGQIYCTEVNGWVDEIIAEILATDELKAEMAEEFEERFKLQGARAWIETEFEQRDNTKSWRDALRSTLQRAYDVKHKRDLKEAVRGHIRQTVADNAVEDE
jgi:DNA topoisomerase VI subunit B